MTRGARITLNSLTAALGIAAAIVVNYATATASRGWWAAVVVVAVVVVIIAAAQGWSMEVPASQPPGDSDAYSPLTPHGESTYPVPTYRAPQYGVRRDWVRKASAVLGTIVLVAAGLGVGLVGLRVGGVKLETLPRVGRNLLVHPKSVTGAGLTVSVDRVSSWGTSTKVSMTLYNRTGGTYVLNQDMCHLAIPGGRTLVGRRPAIVIYPGDVVIYPGNRVSGTTVFDEALPPGVTTITVSWVHLNSRDGDEVVVSEIPLTT